MPIIYQSKSYFSVTELAYKAKDKDLDDKEEKDLSLLEKARLEEIIARNDFMAKRIEIESFDNLPIVVTTLKLPPTPGKNVAYLAKNADGGFIATDKEGQYLAEIKKVESMPFVIPLDEPGRVMIAYPDPTGGHSGLSKGRDVIYAGEININGKNLRWDNDSGHFKPFVGNMYLAMLSAKPGEAPVLNMESFAPRKQHL